MIPAVSVAHMDSPIIERDSSDGIELIRLNKVMLHPHASCLHVIRIVGLPRTTGSGTPRAKGFCSCLGAQGSFSKVLLL